MIRINKKIALIVSIFVRLDVSNVLEVIAKSAKMGLSLMKKINASHI